MLPNHMCFFNKMLSKCLTSMTDTIHEMPEQDFPVHKQPFYKMNHQHLLPIKSGHLELCFSLRSLPFIKYRIWQEHFIMTKDPHSIKEQSRGLRVTTISRLATWLKQSLAWPLHAERSEDCINPRRCKGALVHAPGMIRSSPATKKQGVFESTWWC